MSKLFLIPILFLSYTLNSQDLKLYPLSTSNSTFENLNSDVIDYYILAKNNSKDTMEISKLDWASSMYFYRYNNKIKIPPNDYFLILGSTHKKYAEFIKDPISFYVHYNLILNDTVLRSGVVRFYEVDFNLLVVPQIVNKVNYNDLFKNKLKVSFMNLHFGDEKSNGVIIRFKEGRDTINIKIDSIVLNNKRISNEIYLNNIHNKLLRFNLSKSPEANYALKFYYRDRKNKRKKYIINL